MWELFYNLLLHVFVDSLQDNSCC